MKILVVGLGSMGKRRVRLLKEFLELDVIGVDSSRNRVLETEQSYNIVCYTSIEQAFAENKIEAAVISTSPLSHYSIAMDLLERNVHVFTEINLVDDGYETLMALAKEKEKVLFLSSTMMYRQEIKRLKEVVCSDAKWSYSYHIGQYLPDWHPWENYKNFFVADKKTNACREILAIEFPWLIDIFGKVKDFQIIKKKNTELEVDYQDTYMIIVEHENGNQGSVIVDVVCRKAVREFTLFNEQHFIQWNGTPTGYAEYDLDSKQMNTIDFKQKIIKDSRYADNIIENVYLDELKAYFDKIENPEHKYYDFSDDLYTLKLISEMEKK